MKEQKTLYDNIHESIQSGIWKDEEYIRKYGEYDYKATQMIYKDIEEYLKIIKEGSEHEEFIDRIIARKNLSKWGEEENIYLSHNQ